MDEAENKPKQPNPPSREISNANLFSDEIVFSDTEKILFEEDLKESAPPGRDGLMNGNPEQRYSATRKLNEGGMKAIWEVDDHRTARKVLRTAGRVLQPLCWGWVARTGLASLASS